MIQSNNPNPLPSPINNANILVAEDDADDRFLMQKALEETGSTEQIDFVENGVDVLKYLNAISLESTQRYPNFILLDLNMPKMGGCEVLTKIKTHDLFKKIPVIVFSTNQDQLEIDKCYSLGANTYIVKPPCFDLLVQTVDSIMQYWFNIATFAAVRN